ncbi:hypothetical protein [Streptomyces sp. NPDC058657]|uniref:hypothetical protein n=1 Tax=unclassified Streptomyces TaxID=2593676 RepID=UPI00365B6158
MNVRHVLAAATATAALSVLAVPAAHAADTAAELPACYDVSTAFGDYEQKLIKADISRITGPVVGGGPWEPFTVTVTSTAAADVQGVTQQVTFGRQTENGEDQPGPYLDVEYKSNKTGQWVALEGSGGALEPIGTLKPKQSVTHELRMRVSKDVPAVINFANGYLSAGVDDLYTHPETGAKIPCKGSAANENGFEIKQPGAAVPTGKPTTAPPKPTATATRPGRPGEGKPTGQPAGGPGATASAAPTSAAPSPSGSPSTQLGGVTGTAAAGGATTGDPVSGNPAATGNLAATGSSSALPAVGLVGGAAVLLGVVAVIVVRRKGRA